jgi:hypothetical protein
VTKDELYPVIDEMLHQRWHPNMNAGSAWIDVSEGDIQLRIHELAEALCDAIVERNKAKPVMSGDDIVQRLRRRDGGIGTHWVGCFDSHPVCAIRLAANVIEVRDAEIERLRAEVERLTDELQQVANEIALAESQEARRG